MRVATFVVSVVFLSLPSISFAQAPAAGVPYQIPAGFEAYPSGTLITYGGYNYVVQPNATMLLAASQPAQVPQVVQPTQPTQPTQYYQVPAGYGGYAAGTAINYGGYNYIIQPNGTMAPNWVIQQDINRIRQDQIGVQNGYNQMGIDIRNGNPLGVISDIININNREQQLERDQSIFQRDISGRVPYYYYP